MIVGNATEPHLFWCSHADRPIPRAIRSHGVQRLAPSHAKAAASPAVIFVDCEPADAASELRKLRADTGPEDYLIPVLPELRAEDVVSLVAHGANDAACRADLDLPAPIIKRAKDQAQLMRLAREGGANLPRLLNFVDGMDSPVFLKDTNGLYTGANNHFENFIGADREGVQGKTVYDIAPSDLALTYHRADLELFARGGTQIYAAGMRHATRGVRPVRLYKRTLHDPAGRIVGIVGTIHEIGDARGQRAVRAEFDALNGSSGFAVDSPLGTAPVTDPDRPLLARIAAGEPSALARLYDLYRARLARFVRRLSSNDSLIEEIVNDTFLVVWNKAQEFRAECAVSTWLMAIAYRCALKALREQRHTLLEVELTHPDLVLEYWHDYETPDLLAKAFDVLSEDLRLAMALAYLFGHSIEEIAQITGCPVTTVKARLHRARGKLRTRLTMLGEPGYA